MLVYALSWHTASEAEINAWLIIYQDHRSQLRPYESDYTIGDGQKQLYDFTKDRHTRSDSRAVVPSKPGASCRTPAARSIDDELPLLFFVMLWTAIPMNVLQHAESPNNTEGRAGKESDTDIVWVQEQRFQKLQVLTQPRTCIVGKCKWMKNQTREKMSMSIQWIMGKINSRKHR